MERMSRGVAVLQPRAAMMRMTRARAPTMLLMTVKRLPKSGVPQQSPAEMKRKRMMTVAPATPLPPRRLVHQMEMAAAVIMARRTEVLARGGDVEGVGAETVVNVQTAVSDAIAAREVVDAIVVMHLGDAGVEGADVIAIAVVVTMTALAADVVAVTAMAVMIAAAALAVEAEVAADRGRVAAEGRPHGVLAEEVGALAAETTELIWMGSSPKTSSRLELHMLSEQCQKQTRRRSWGQTEERIATCSLTA